MTRLMDESSPYLRRETRAVEEVMSGARARGRRQRRGWRKTAADRYVRRFSELAELVGIGNARRAIADPLDPVLTWTMLRELCWHLRSRPISPVGSHARRHRIEMIAAGEARLLFKQWATRTDKRLLRAEQSAHDMIEGRG